MVRLLLPALWVLAPEARQVYKEGLAHADSILPRWGLTTKRRVDHFLAQILHESGGLTVLNENLTYTTPERLMAVWPARFPTVDSATPYLRNPRALANLVYGGRMGNTEPDDGWEYHGRGLTQLTGKANYRRIGTLLGVDLVAVPELVLTADWCLPVAGAFWVSARASVPADLDDLRGVTKAINGGLTGLKDRERWLRKVRTAAVVEEDSAATG